MVEEEIVKVIILNKKNKPMEKLMKEKSYMLKVKWYISKAKSYTNVTHRSIRWKCKYIHLRVVEWVTLLRFLFGV